MAQSVLRFEVDFLQNYYQVSPLQYTLGFWLCILIDPMLHAPCAVRFAHCLNPLQFLEIAFDL